MSELEYIDRLAYTLDTFFLLYNAERGAWVVEFQDKAGVMQERYSDTMIGCLEAALKSLSIPLPERGGAA